MAISKVIFNNETQIDLTNATATPDKILTSYTAYGANGTRMMGSANISSTVNAAITQELKQALLQIARKVAYIDDDGQNYYQDLYNALIQEEQEEQ